MNKYREALKILDRDGWEHQHAHGLGENGEKCMVQSVYYALDPAGTPNPDAITDIVGTLQNIISEYYGRYLPEVTETDWGEQASTGPATWNDHHATLGQVKFVLTRAAELEDAKLKA